MVVFLGHSQKKILPPKEASMEHFSNNNNKTIRPHFYISTEYMMGRRVYAMLFDILLLGICYYFSYNVLQQHPSQGVIYGLYLLCSILYFAGIPSFAKGTIGQLICSLRCVKTDENYTEFTAYLNRYIAFFFPLIVYLFFMIATFEMNQDNLLKIVLAKLASEWVTVFYLWAGACVISIVLNPDKQGFHDKLSGTMIIHVEKQSD